MSHFKDGSYSCTQGIALIAKVLAGQCQMKYTRVAVGKGKIPDGQSPKTMKQPADYVMDAKISSVTNPVNGECLVTVQINSSDVESGFYATGLLLYAEDPDEGEVPYTYLVLENGPEWIRPSSSIVGKLATFDLIAAVGDVENVTAIIDPQSFVTQTDLQAVATVADKAQNTAENAGAAALLAQAVANKAQSTAEGKADGTHKHKKSDINDFPTSMTPTSHASVNATYGTGNGSDYGHVKLSDSTNSSSGVSSGIAATPAAVKSAKTAADEAKNIIKELLKDVTLSGSKLTFTKSNGKEVTITFENATDNKSGQMSNTDKKNLDKLVEQAFTDVAIDFDTLTITFSSMNQQQDINLKDYFTPKTKQFNTGTETDEGTQLNVNGGTQFVRCDFEPKIVKLYHNNGSGFDPDEYNAKHYGCLIIWWENGETIYSDNIGNLAGTIEPTSDGFYFNAPGAAVDFNLRWEAYA